MPDDLLRHLDETVAAVQRRAAPAAPRIAIVLGSGLGGLVERLTGAVAIPYADLPHWPVSTVQGHAGKLVFGALAGRPIVALQGRAHYYEGYDIRETTYPIRVLARLGVRVLLVTNSAGSATKEMRPGDLMLIADHINLLGQNPLRGPNADELGPRFPDLSAAYDPELADLAERAALDEGVPLKRGVYLATPGPSYETPAEVRMMRLLGADAIGMSTVQETIVARHMGLRVLGISCITNMACGIAGHPLSHDEVIETGRRVADAFSRLLARIIGSIEA
ncbi:MAG: purine-nucleoside phosphorylase [Planctomycetes bacterium]|nr:purine-nucleoside phosphorylase [Planctomycetota bacterium]